MEGLFKFMYRNSAPDITHCHRPNLHAMSQSVNPLKLDKPFVIKGYKWIWGSLVGGQ